jgi:hypothetical protein
MPRTTRKIVTRSKVRFAPAAAVEDYLAEAPAQALKCRDKGHRWGDEPYDIEGSRRKGFVRFWKCKCGAMLEEHLDTHGVPLPGETKLKYPEGYLMPKGTGRLSREDRGQIRLANIEAQQHRLALRALKQKKAS